MSTSNGFAVRPALLAGLLAIAAAMPAMAQETGGLGAAFPQAQNVSVAPGYAVYRFVRDGVGFIQINTTSGQVLGAMAASNGHYLVLPIGTAIVSTPELPQVASNGAEVKVYDDGTTQISAVTINGKIALQVVPASRAVSTGTRRTSAALSAAGGCEPCTHVSAAVAPQQ